MTPVRSIDIDACLQASYLVVVQLRHGVSARESTTLKSECANQVAQVRQALKDAGISPRNIDFISYAQCALLDDSVLRLSTGLAHCQWAEESLQARFFQQHEGGERLYENIAEVLSEPNPEPLVLTVFQRVLMLGFLGRYRYENDPQREQLLQALNARVEPLDISLARAGAVVADHSTRGAPWLHSPLIHLFSAAVVLATLWFGFDHLLDTAIDAVLAGRAFK
ncbi:type VI secretion system protein TssL, short form [Pseudomonas turukhanskensis]|uniref:Type VI secretion protein ImpK n=1 Tax=Pseudomonas turukhanskensis TaxID=1806536 RepID=A0A9W6K7T2_9PSED|nr:type VI secretion system protein TssL, short form [Pseudomonas turukhanskensis]GLK89285.1 type VI secretion protein ImpK [Pseudomonas turukhanskensis]